TARFVRPRDSRLRRCRLDDHALICRSWSTLTNAAEVLAKHVRRGDLDHQMVLYPEFDDMKCRRSARCATAEIPRPPAFTLSDSLHRLAVRRYGKKQVERPVFRGRVILELPRHVTLARLQGDCPGINLDHRAVFVAVDGHERAGDRTWKRKAAAVH